jgi:hypothetical protein
MFLSTHECGAGFKFGITQKQLKAIANAGQTTEFFSEGYWANDEASFNE